jgi:FtsX-like permease family
VRSATDDREVASRRAVPAPARSPYLVAAVAGVLALLNLAHHLILSTRRRRRDLAVLRALGADRGWVTDVVHWQASLFTIVVVALGAPIGIAAGRVVYRTFVDRIGAVDTVTLPFGLYALTLAGLVALANVMAAHSAHRARHQSPADSLTDERGTRSRPPPLSGIGLDGKGVAVGVLEPGDPATAGSRSDAFAVSLEGVVAGELDASSSELVDGLVDVLDVPCRQRRP